VVLGRQVPFPSGADAGFLAFPLFATAALWLWSGTRDSAAVRGRDLMDGAIIAGSLLVLSWSTTLGEVLATSSGGWLAVALSLAYPVGDVVLATLVLLVMSRAVAARATMLLLAAGLGALAVADSAYSYLVATGAYTSGDAITAGWVLGFLLVGLAALVDEPERVGGTRRADVERGLSPGLRLLLPYLPLTVAGSITITGLSEAIPLAELCMAVALVVLVLARQFFAMLENQRLVKDLEAAREQLQYQAWHDPLTGLANRPLFADRLHRALAEPDASVAVMFCDLDDFKNVNDELGHEAGDQLLQLVAERLRGCVRPTDTVARLGGDEFAVLLREQTRADLTAKRIVAAIQQPYQLGVSYIQTSVSVGIAAYPASTLGHAPDSPLRIQRDGEAAPARSPEEIAEELLKDADTAMYGAKAAGKGRAVLYEQTSARDRPGRNTLPA
jgi:diguanylate cyclase (GGDEF)-like protein